MENRYEDKHLKHFYGTTARSYNQNKYQARGNTMTNNRSTTMHVPSAHGMDQMTTERYVTRGVPSHSTSATYKKTRALGRDSISHYKY